MGRHEISCVNIMLPGTHPSHITKLGNHKSEPAWRITTTQAIERISKSIDTFFVVDHTTGLEFPIRISLYEGHPYLRSSPEDVVEDLLLSLPECP